MRIVMDVHVLVVSHANIMFIWVTTLSIGHRNINPLCIFPMLRLNTGMLPMLWQKFVGSKIFCWNSGCIIIVLLLCIVIILVPFNFRVIQFNISVSNTLRLKYMLYVKRCNVCRFGFFTCQHDTTFRIFPLKDYFQVLFYDLWYNIKVFEILHLWEYIRLGNHYYVLCDVWYT